jgi:hypothetical protein
MEKLVVPEKFYSQEQISYVQEQVNHCSICTIQFVVFHG